MAMNSTAMVCAKGARGEEDVFTANSGFRGAALASHGCTRRLKLPWNADYHREGQVAPETPIIIPLLSPGVQFARAIRGYLFMYMQIAALVLQILFRKLRVRCAPARP